MQGLMLLTCVQFTAYVRFFKLFLLTTDH